MKAHGVTVERPIVPTSIELSKSEEELKDPNARPVKVIKLGSSLLVTGCGPDACFALPQVTLKYLDAPDREGDSEVVHAKFVLGADGMHRRSSLWFRTLTSWR